MSNNRWGHCQNCRYFGSLARTPLVNEEAPCKQPELAKHKLVVFGASGCTLFAVRPGLHPRDGETARA